MKREPWCMSMLDLCEHQTIFCSLRPEHDGKHEGSIREEWEDES